MSRYLLGYDVGSSSIKAALLDIDGGVAAAAAVSPEREMPIAAPRPGWAEQDPRDWWEHVVRVTAALGRQADLREVAAVGVAYQMHGLVCLDRAGELLRPAIIWCDSRAVQTGARAFAALGEGRCLRQLLNSPGNFTTAKLAWVKENEPGVFRRIDKVLLPGDYVAWRLTGEMGTTPVGLSEAVLWDFQEGALARFLLEHWGIPEQMLPPLLPTFGPQGALSARAAEQLGLRPVMTLSSELIAVHDLQKGDRVGYGGVFSADEPMRIGIVACGYADGYPRHAPTGTPILVEGHRTRTVGRVSMDMIMVDLTGIPAAGIGSPVVLWGEGLPVDDVAAAAGTVSYELFCALSARVSIVEMN